MLFYVNVQNKTKFDYVNKDNVRVGDYYETTEQVPIGGVKPDYIKSSNRHRCKCSAVNYRKGILNRLFYKSIRVMVHI